MKLYLEVLIGAAVGAGVYVVARHQDAPASVAVDEKSPDRVPPERGGFAPLGPRGFAAPLGGSEVARPAPEAPRNPRAEHDDRVAMNALKTAIIVRTSEDMQKRGADVRACARSLDLAGTQKLRFSVAADSTPGSADFGPWRFREIVEGEALPDSFGPCAERALGQGGHVTTGSDSPFPDYRGDVDVIYTLPAP